MDSSSLSPSTAILSTLSAIARSAHSLLEFIRDVPVSRTTLDPVTYELIDVRTILERLLDDAGIPAPLQPPVLALLTACRHVLARIDVALAGCDDGSTPQSSLWAAKGKDEVRALKARLQACRETMRLAHEVVNLAAAIEFMADTNAIGIGATDIKQDASQILVRAYRLQAQTSRGDGDGALSRGLEGLVGYVESVCGEEGRNEESRVMKWDNSGREALTPGSRSRQPSYPYNHITHALSRMSTADTTSNSISSSESRSISEASGTWFTAEDEELSPTQSQPQPHRRPAHQRHHASDRSLSRRDTQSPAMPALTKTPSFPSPLPVYSLYPPPPTKPLPALPPQRRSSRASSSNPPPTPRTSRHSKGSVATASTSDRGSSISYPVHPPPSPPKSPPKVEDRKLPSRAANSSAPSDIKIVPWKQLSLSEKEKKNETVFYLDGSPTSSVLASKHGNNMIYLWDMRSGEIQCSIKITFYVQSQPRSRDFFVRSHSILSETTNYIGISTGFGHTLEIWNWAKRKKLQTINDAYRWASVRRDIHETTWPPLAVYRDDSDAIDLYPLNRDGKKPFGKPHAIELRKAGLQHIPKYPELAYSSTGPLLIAAAGPRPPRPGVPPPEHAAMLMAWELDDSDTPTHRPYKFVRPDLHTELENALPLCLATYGSVAVSIWLPGSYRAVPGRGQNGGWGLEAVTVTNRHVLVWDFAANSTRTYPIPDAAACVSPDCRWVAYCDAARAFLVVVEAMTGRELWRFPPEGPDSVTEFAQLRDLGKVVELAFSGDGSLLFVGDSDGGIGVYEVREGQAQGLGMRAS